MVCVNIVVSGIKVTSVPFLEVAPTFLTGYDAFPRSYSCSQTLPSRKTVAFRCSDRAFTQETPTPCNPPETLYESLSNLPPAPILVMTTSSAETPSFLCIPTGIPRPLSSTVMELFSLISTDIKSQCPARASSMELSTTSYTKWCNPLTPTSPIYMDGRIRTCSMPSRA